MSYLMTWAGLVLADEPAGNLDNISAQEVLGLMREVNNEAGTTFVICTHAEHVAARYARA